MISILMVTLLMNATIPVADMATVNTGPLVFPDAMSQATSSIIAIPQDLAGQHDTWLAGIWAFLGNNSSLNLTNTTGLFYA
jgi:hypothetical protein